MSEPSRAQTWTAEGYERHARFVSDLGAAVLDLLAPRAGERILDLGCGDGALSARIAAAGAAVVGADTSDDLLDAARARGLDARHIDGHALPFETEFDAVFSNAALHWMGRPREVVAGVARALKPGGRFVGEFGGHGNVAAIVTAMRAVGMAHKGNIALAGPWFFPTPAEYSQILAEAGFAVQEIALHPRPTPLPTGMAAWLATFRKPFFDQFDGSEREEVLGEVEELLRPCLCDSAGQWTADYVRLRFAARLEEQGI
jgi:SAM-dependent methyltransferase